MLSIGVVKSVMYSANVARSCGCIWPFAMSQPPRHTITVYSAPMSAAMPAWYVPMARYIRTLESRYASLLVRNLSFSTSSAAKPFTTRMPARLSSTREFTPEMRTRFSRKMAFMRRFARRLYAVSTTSTAASTSVSGTFTNPRITNEPTISTAPMSRNSGPWWAVSLLSNRSLTRRLMRSPDLLRSKNEKLMRW